jgi:hypothetical protein
MEFVSYLTILWIEQHLNTCVNQSEIRQQINNIVYECEAEQLIEEMNNNRLIPGFHYTPHKVEDQYFAIRFMVDKDNYHDRTSSTT